MSFSGHCLCGAVSYTSDADPVATAICHCDDCQRQSGSPFSLNVLIPEDELALTGELKVFNTTGSESGEPRVRCVCPTCGSPIFTRLAEMPGLVALKAGTLDDRSWLEPEMEVWCDRKHGWMDAGAERGEFPTGLPT
jgi:hypothetical protein